MVSAEKHSLGLRLPIKPLHDTLPWRFANRGPNLNDAHEMQTDTHEMQAKAREMQAETRKQFSLAIQHYGP